MAASKEFIKSWLSNYINNARSPEDWHYLRGMIEGLRLADVITPAEADKYRERVANRIKF